MQTLDNYLMIEPYEVLVDDSPQLRELAERAKLLRSLSFQGKLEAVKALALEAMPKNAYELSQQPRTRVEETEVLDRRARRATIESTGRDSWSEIAPYHNLVREKHPLSDALQLMAGCCRYQGALFFVLGYEAEIGDIHFLQAAVVDPSNRLPLDQALKTVFNEVFHNGERHVVSIFRESVKDPRHDYTRRNPDIFDKAIEEYPGANFYSYHRAPSGLVLAVNKDRHIRD